MAEGDTAINALLGAIVSTVFAGVVPLAPLLGGAISGYLQGGDRSTGVRVGLYAGLIAFVPTFLLLLVVGGLFLGAMGLAGGSGLAGLGTAIIVFIFVVTAVYVIGLSAAGGWLGNYVRYDTDLDI